MQRIFALHAALQPQLLLLVLLSLVAVTNGFVAHSGNSRLWTAQGSVSTGPWSLAALTERQMQFWEDVDSGLDDIENFYAKKGQDINRIRTFAKT